MVHPIRILKYVGLSLITLCWLFFLLSWAPVYQPEEMEYGITFSSKQSRDLGLDWKENYLAMLDDLKVERLRLPIYWDIVQPEEGRFDWSEIDWQVDEAEKRGVDLILVVGTRVPRWPECHLPNWAKEAETVRRQEATLEYLRAAVTRYKQRPTVSAWQVENEPFLVLFGECPPLDVSFLDKEIAEVRSLDSRPIIVTDSGELSAWVPAAGRGDIFGSTLYRYTYSSTVDRYVHYPISPLFFRIKKNISNLFAHPQDWIIIELQGEPWGKKAFQELSLEERSKTMTPQKFTEMAEFARQTGFRTLYWWGVEYWYWEKTKNDTPFYWEEAKHLFDITHGNR